MYYYSPLLLTAPSYAYYITNPFEYNLTFNYYLTDHPVNGETNPASTDSQFIEENLSKVCEKQQQHHKPEPKVENQMPTQYGSFEKSSNTKRNIIPNLARKILKFLTTNQSKPLIHQFFPHLTKSQVYKFYEFTKKQKAKFGFYVGARELNNIWHRDDCTPKQREYLRMIRILSKYFLEQVCVTSVLLSKRMQESFKLIHLTYRRKLIRMLEKPTHILQKTDS